MFLHLRELPGFKNNVKKSFDVETNRILFVSSSSFKNILTLKKAMKQ